MARIIIIGPSQPSRTPRLVRNADALSAAGHEVTVITPVLEHSMLAFDSELVARSKWKYLPVSLLNSAGEIGFSYRIFRKIIYSIASKLPLPRFGSKALIYGEPKMASVLKHLDADMYLAQQQASLPLVAQVAKKRNKNYACDIEDILTESSTEPVQLLASIEMQYLKNASVVSTMSAVAAEYLDGSLDMAHKVLSLHNCSNIEEREGVKAPTVLSATKPSIYWFGQTLGPHSLATELIMANAAAGHPFRIILRGRPVANYLQKISEISRASGSVDLVEILPIVKASEMVSEAAKYDVLFGSQPSQQLFHQLAIGNKVFTGLLAGCALLLTDTIAHRKLAPELQGGIRLVGNDHDALVSALESLAKNQHELLEMRKASWNSGTARYHWAEECKPWVSAINAALKGQ